MRGSQAEPRRGRAKRKVVKRLPDYLRPNEVQPLIAALKPKWKPLFAAATGPLRRPRGSRARSRRVAPRSLRYPPTRARRCASRLRLVPICTGPPRSPRTGDRAEELERILAGLSCRGERI